jgi:hypothetical protein
MYTVDRKGPVGRVRLSLLLLPTALVIVGLLVATRSVPSSTGGSGSEQTSASAEVSSSPSPFPDHDYVVTVASGLNPALDPEMAAALALRVISGNEGALGRSLAQPRILSIDALSGSAVPDDLGEGNLANYPIVWVVRAEGTFLPFSCPALDLSACPMDSDGYLILDDTGRVIVVGFPLPKPSSSATTNL